MLPENPLLQLTLPRVQNTLQQLERAIWERQGGGEITYFGSQAEFQPLEAVRKQRGESVALPFHWGRLYDHAWFQIQLSAPSEPGDYLRWNDRGEGTAYIDGVPYAGYDTCHKEWPLPPGTQTIWMEGLCLQRGIWGGEERGLTAQGALLEEVAILRRNEAVWDAYHDLKLLFDLALDEGRRQQPHQPLSTNGPGFKPPLISASFLLRRLLRGLDEATGAFDQHGLPGLAERLTALYGELRSSDPKLRARLTGHAHIDLVWLWTEACGEYKAVHTFANMSRLLAIYPEFRFGYSQPASYEAVQRRAPKLMDQVRQHIQEGRWETPGAGYVECDTLLACGEALARGIELGHRSFHEIAGQSSPVFWLPDVFGYTGCLPQILKETDTDYFFTTKLAWSTITQFPYSSFRWRGIDGSEVIAHIVRTHDYNCRGNITNLRDEADAYRQGDVHDEFLLPCGIGDGGGGPDADICERVRRVESLIGVPETGWGLINDFFHGLKQNEARLPTYQGELYFEYHRGTYTTHHDLKAAFRAAERGLQIREAAHCLTGQDPVEDHPWKRLIFAQFHDYIPGSSIWDVYREGVPELQQIATTQTDAAIKRLTGSGQAKPALFNPLPQPVLAVAEAKLIALPPLSVTPLDTAPEHAAPAVVARDESLDNGRVHARLDSEGRLRELVVQGQAVRLEAPSAEIWAYPDNPHRYPAWDIDRQTLSLGQPLPLQTRRLASSPASSLGASIVFESSWGTASKLITTYSLRPDSSVLEIRHDLEWGEEKTLLKAIFHTGYQGCHARYGAPFGSVRRPQQAGDASAEAMFEVPGSRWAMVTDDNESEGLFIVTESKYGFSCRDGHLGLSLIRAAEVPCTRVDNAIHRHPPESFYSDTGQTSVIRYAVGRWSPDLRREEHPAALADSHFTTPLAVETSSAAGLHAGFLGLQGGESLIPCWAKPLAPGQWVLRLQETLGRNGSCEVQLAPGYRMQRVDLSNRSLGAAADSLNRLEFSAYQIVSVRIEKES